MGDIAKLNDVAAFLALFGPVVQQVLELISPLINPQQGWRGMSVADTKGWICKILGFVLGIVVTLFSNQSVPSMNPAVSVIVIVALSVVTASAC